MCVMAHVHNRGGSNQTEGLLPRRNFDDARGRRQKITGDQIQALAADWLMEPEDLAALIESGEIDVTGLLAESTDSRDSESLYADNQGLRGLEARDDRRSDRDSDSDRRSSSLGDAYSGRHRRGPDYA